MPELSIKLKLVQADRPAIYKFVRGSFGPDSTLRFSVVDEADNPVSLENKTVFLVLFHKITQFPILEKECTIEQVGTPPDDEWFALYEPKEGDFSFLNIYYLRLKIKDVDNETFTERVLFQVV